ncbi:MAG: hypothetical protein EPN34_03040 [Burkholderiaceae bacterium]|nr:MAG: hypothetical protein EPN34_03040 [Burkholderiaceae bacterium]
MADKNLELKITADAAQARQSVADLAARVEQLAASSSGELKGALTSAAAGLRQMAAQSDLTAASLHGMAGNLASDLERAAASASGDLKPALQGAAQGARDIEAEARKAAGATDELKNSGNAVEAAFTKVGRAMAGLFAASKIKNFAVDAIATADAYGQMAERIRMATASQQEYEQVQQRLLETANTTYRGLSEQQELYIRTADALRGMGYETSQVLDITDSLSFLLTTNAASAEKGAAAIDAYTKSIQSGRVDSQSWQTLLAATPTLVDAVAKATGKTAAEIRQLGVAGQLSVASLNEGLRRSVDANKAATEGMVTTVNDAMKRLSNTWSVYLGQANSATGATQKIVGVINLLSENLDTVIAAAVKAGEVLAAMAGARALTALSAYVTQLGAAATGTVALTGATTGLAGALARAKVAMEGLAAASKGLALAALATEVLDLGLALNKWRNAAAGARESQRGLDDANARLAARFREVSEQTGVSVVSMEELDAAVAAGAIHFDDAAHKWAAGAGTAAQMAGAQRGLTLATEEGRKAAGDAALLWGQLAESYAKVNAATATQTDLATKQVAAAKARGEAAVAEARLLGDEAALRKATGDAAAAEAGALADLAAKRQTQADVLKAELAAKQAVLDQSPVITQAQKDEIEQLKQSIEARQIEADAARAQALASAANAKAKGEEAQAAEAATEAARAAAITRKAESDSAISLLQTQKELAGQSEALARLMGNEEAARRFRIQQLEIDIKITQAKAEAMKAEAQGSIAVAQATLEELRVKGELTKVKEAELQASIKVAEAKLKEADAIRQSAGVTQQAINNMREFGNEAGRAGRAGREAGDQVAGSWRGAAGSIRDATAAQKEFAAAQDLKYGRAGQSASLGTQKSGEMSVSQGVNSWQSIYSLAKGRGASEADARRIADSMFDASGKYVGQPLQRFGESASAAAARMAGEAVRFGGAPAAGAASAPPSAPATGNGGPSFVSHINIPGLGTTSAGFADRQSQDNVTNLLKRLASDKARAL